MTSLHYRLLGSTAFSMAGAREAPPIRVFFSGARSMFAMDELGKEILRIAVPAALALAADPIASLVDTAFIGRIGPVELAAVGVAIAVFNQASRIAIFPLVSVTTSFVAEDDAACEMAAEAELENGDSELSFPVESELELKELIPLNDTARSASKESLDTDRLAKGLRFERKRLPSASSALIIGGVLGLLQAFILISGAIPILKFMGLKYDSPMLTPAYQYLTLRSLGAPAVLLSLAMQGIFRGLKNTRTPLYATVAGDAINVVLDPIFMFVFHLGVSGAAIAHVISQYLIAFILFWRLMRQVDVLPPSIRDLQFSRFLKNGFLLLARVIAATFCVTLAASMAARQGPVPMAAFQICLQVWLAISLLADGLAVAGQAILASAFAKKDLARATTAASRVLQLSVVLGLVLGAWCCCWNWFAVCVNDIHQGRGCATTYSYRNPVCGTESTDKCNGICFRWYQLWGLGLCIFCVFYDPGGLSEHSVRSCPLFWLWICWNLDSFDDLHEPTNVCRFLEDWNCKGAMDLSPRVVVILWLPICRKPGENNYELTH